MGKGKRLKVDMAVMDAKNREIDQKTRMVFFFYKVVDSEPD